MALEREEIKVKLSRTKNTDALGSAETIGIDSGKNQARYLRTSDFQAEISTGQKQSGVLIPTKSERDF